MMRCNKCGSKSRNGIKEDTSKPAMVKEEGSEEINFKIGIMVKTFIRGEMMNSSQDTKVTNMQGVLVMNTQGANRKINQETIVNKGQGKSGPVSLDTITILKGRQSKVINITQGTLVINNSKGEKTSEGILVNNSQGTMVKPSRRTLVMPSQGTEVKPSPRKMVKRSQGTTVKTSQGTMVKTSPGTLVKPSQGTLVKPSQGTLVKPSQGTMVKTSQGTMVKPNQKNTVRRRLGNFEAWKLPLGPWMAPLASWRQPVSLPGALLPIVDVHAHP